MKNFKKTILLFIILIAVGTYYFYEIKSSSEREKKRSESKRLFIIDKNKITSLFIKNGDKEIEIVKKNQDWIIKDKNYQCDKNEIDGIINKISSLEFEREIEGISDFSQYGLDNPSKIIKFQQNGEKYILYIGNESPTGSYLYATKDKIDLFLVDKWDLNNILEKEIFDLRDKRIMPVDIVKTDIEEIEIKKGEKLISLINKGDGWYINNPIDDLADKEKIEKIIENIIDGKVKNFEEDKKEKECGFEKPSAIFKIKVKNNEYFLYLGKKMDDLYYAKNSEKPYIFLIEDKILEDIPEEINNLRSKKVFDFDISEVNEIIITKKQGEFKFIKEKENYYLEKERRKKISKERIENFLYDLKNLQINEFIEYPENKLKDYQISPPEIKISLCDNKRKTEIYFGKKVKDNIFCYNPKRKILFTIPSSDYDKINKEKEFFIEKENKSK
ncbi:MAG: DUF4340 domain-containing protein [Candidatus Omnitrophica bacterium]|nr:DUF4340 domain-containing protein [Candidatus Omnitrophota bacterium]